MTIRLSYLTTIIIAITIIFIGNRFAVDGLFSFYTGNQEDARARVIRIIDTIHPQDRYHFFDDFDEYDEMLLNMMGISLVFEAEVTRGPRRGQILTVEQSLGSSLGDTPTQASPGDSVLLISFGDGWFYNGHIRTNRLLVLGILFIIGVLIFGRTKGFNTVLSLGLTCAAIFAVFIPSILSGKNIYLMSGLICIYTTITTLSLVIGYNKKALAAAIGCLSGIAVTGIITLIMDHALYLTGMINEHSRHLTNLPLNNPINLRAIIFAGIIIGAMGAIMDVAMSISSSMWEIKEKVKDISIKNLLSSGINIGRDIMGTMANTLVLAYIGTSLSVVLVISVYSNSIIELFNREMIIVEILQGLAGIFGVLLAMPLTAVISAVLYSKKHNSDTI